MALVEAVSFTLSAAVEVASLVWMEIAMFGAAALIYIFVLGGGLPAVLPSKKKVMDDGDASKWHKGRQSRSVNLVTSAARRGLLDEALGHLRQMPPATDATPSALPSSAAIRVLALALREKRVADAVAELQRIHMQLETKQLSDLIAVESKKAGGAEACQELIDAAVALNVPKEALVKSLSDHAASTRHSACSNGAKDELQRHAAMIKTHARDNDLAGATRVFNQVRSSGATLGPMIYNCFLDACGQCGEMERAKAHFSEMKQLDVLDVVGYNIMIKAYLSKRYTQEAHNLLKEMSARGLQANKITYNELLHAKVLERDRQGIWNLVEDMRVAGVRANSVTCSILLKSLSEQSHSIDVKRVISLIDDMEESIDEVLFSSVIEACIRIRQLDVLSELMQRFRQKGGFVNLAAPTYGSMIKAYGQAGNVVRVRELWREMGELGVKPTSITLGCMTEALVKNEKPDEAWELLQAQLEDEDRKGSVNTVIYSTVLKGFAVSRRIDKVFNVYQDMRSKNIPCNTITYNTMLDACAKCCTMKRASSLLEDMRESSVEPDIITYSTIVKGYCLEGDVEKAFNVLEDMKGDDNFAPDEIMYNSILDGCAKQHRVDDALRLLEEMQSSGIIPSNYTLSILVKLLGHARRLTQAFNVVDELSQQHGLRPNVQVYTCLVQACLTNRKLDRAIALHDTMVADPSCKTDEKFYAVLARGCLQLHQPLKAIEVVRAAYQLPGHSMAIPARKGAWPVGVEARALDEIASRLRAGGKEERDAMASLTADLVRSGVHLGEGRGACGAGYHGAQRGRRGGANRGGKCA